MRRELTFAMTLLVSMPSSGFCADCAPGPDDPPSTGCLLELGDAPTRTGLIPGLSNGRLDPAALSKASGHGVESRTWSEPDPREPGIVLHHIAISGSLLDVLGTHVGSPPYGLTELSVRNPHVALPCGLRVGQPLKAFVTTLAIDLDPERWDPSREVHLAWAKFESYRDTCFASHANISLRLTPTREVREVRWEYFAD